MEYWQCVEALKEAGCALADQAHTGFNHFTPEIFHHLIPPTSPVYFHFLLTADEDQTVHLWVWL